MSRRDWTPIMAEAADITESYSGRVTLRQLFYRLVSTGMLRNTRSDYNQLSSKTAEARRDGTFPELEDRTRSIHRARHFRGPGDARSWLVNIYRRDRTEGQKWNVFIGIEKDALRGLLEDWFRPLGVPILSLRGYASQTYADEVADAIGRDGRAAVLIYAGDFDPSGVDIDRDFRERVGCFNAFERVALSRELIEQYDLPPQMGKGTDSRASQFVEKHGELIQVELDALPPDVLRELYEDAIDDYWDDGTFTESRRREEEDMEILEAAL